MGLDVRVYTNVKETTSDEFDFIAYVIDPEWEWKIKNLVNRGRYTGEVSAKAAGYSYSSHSRFREKLVILTGNTQFINNSDGKIEWELITPELPFYDFINFADNDGCLDWEVSGTIYGDFVKYKSMAESMLEEPFLHRYNEWLTAFETAFNNKGVVVFS